MQYVSMKCGIHGEYCEYCEVLGKLRKMLVSIKVQYLPGPWLMMTEFSSHESYPTFLQSKDHKVDINTFILSSQPI